jgi:hypothetical protein
MRRTIMFSSIRVVVAAGYRRLRETELPAMPLRVWPLALPDPANQRSAIRWRAQPALNGSVAPRSPRPAATTLLRFYIPPENHGLAGTMLHEVRALFGGRGLMFREDPTVPYLHYENR